MSTNETISVIVPVYNAEKYIEKCVNSILNQTYQDIEVIIVDDGSNDKTGKICDSLANEDSRIKVFHKHNGGVVSARNMGLDNVTGEYIAFVDADDWIEPDMFEQQMSALNCIDADMVLSTAWLINNDDYGTSVTCACGNIEKEQLLLMCLSTEKESYGVSIWNKIYKLKLKDSLYMDKPITMGEDMLILCRAILASNNVAVTSYCGYHYMVVETSAMHKFNKSHVTCIEAHELVRELVADYPNVQKYIDLRNQLYCSSLLFAAARFKEYHKETIMCLQRVARKLFFNHSWKSSIRSKIKLFALALNYYSYTLVVKYVMK